MFIQPLIHGVTCVSVVTVHALWNSLPTITLHIRHPEIILDGPPFLPCTGTLHSMRQADKLNNTLVLILVWIPCHWWNNFIIWISLRLHLVTADMCIKNSYRAYWSGNKIHLFKCFQHISAAVIGDKQMGFSSKDFQSLYWW